MRRIGRSLGVNSANVTMPGQALAFYKELLTVVEGASVMLEEYAREMVLAEELHAGEVNKMLRKPGEIDAFRPAGAAEGSLTRNA
jgi:hypothetical protein